MNKFDMFPKHREQFISHRNHSIEQEEVKNSKSILDEETPGSLKEVPNFKYYDYEIKNVGFIPP